MNLSSHLPAALLPLKETVNDDRNAGKEEVIMPFLMVWVYVLLGIHTINRLWGLAPALL